jgi:hypothetical protein
MEREQTDMQTTRDQDHLHQADQKAHIVLMMCAECRELYDVDQMTQLRDQQGYPRVRCQACAGHAPTDR